MKAFLPALALIALLFIGNTAQAQNYRTGLGLRAGYPFGLTIKHFMSERSAVEVILGARNRGVEAIALYEYHVYPAKRKEFDLYFGGGGHLGIFSHNHHHGHGPFNEDDYKDGPDPFINVGLDGIVGCSWTFTNAPVNIGVDYKPAFSFYRYIGYFYGDFAFSVRYAFGASSDKAR